MTGGVAVVIGPTGRNFAAGMSGGARLRPRRGWPSSRAAATSTWSPSSRLDEPEDVEQVRDLLIQHAGYTRSPVAARLLGDWDAGGGSKFIKVMPVDYRRVLDQQREAAREREAARPLEVSGG